MKKEIKYNDADFFDHLASLGEEKINQADVDDIFSRIDARVQQGNAKPKNNGNNIFVSVLVIGFTLVLGVVLFNKNEIIQIGVSPNEAAPIKKDILAAANTIDTIVSELVSNDTAITTNKEIRKQHFTQENSGTHFMNNMSMEDMAIKEVPFVDTTIKTPVTETYLSLLPNAGYIYIYDLKITEYQTLYFKNQRPFTVERIGLGAEYENVNSYLQAKSEKSSLLPYTMDQLLKDALKRFNKAQYKKADALFEELIGYNSTDVNALFYSALCNYYTGKPSVAIERLNMVLKSKNNVFQQEAEWYRALSYAKLGETQQAISLLIKINEKKGFYANDAAEKLGEMKR